MPMNPDESFALVYFERWNDPVAEEILSAKADVRLVRLGRTEPLEKIWTALESAHGYQITSIRTAAVCLADRALIARCPNLLAISTSGAGFDPVDVQACSEAGVIVVNQAGLNKEAVAEHVLGMMLALSKRMIQSDRALRRDRHWRRLDFVGDDIRGKTIGIVGIGNIGTVLAKICAGAFGMTTLAYDPYLSPEEIARRGARKVTLSELLATADFVSLNCPLTEETRGMFGRVQFRTMRPAAYFITTARGGIHDENALAEALEQKWIAGAGLDVFEEEPPALDHPLLAFDNVLATPHNAGGTRQAFRAMAAGAARQWLDIIEGRRPPRLVNPEAWPAFRRRCRRILGRAPAE